MKIDIAPDEQGILIEAIDFAFMEHRNSLSNLSGLSQDESQYAWDELRRIQKHYGKLKDKIAAAGLTGDKS